MQTYSELHDSPTNVSLYLRDVPSTCLSTATATAPCHAHAAHVPSWWYCTFIGANRSSAENPLVMGPYRSRIVHYTDGPPGHETWIGSEVVLDCPLPSPTDLLAVVPFEHTSSSIPFSVRVGAAYGEPRAPLLFGGAADGDVLHFDGWGPPPPPPSPPPPDPPNPPPPSPPPPCIVSPPPPSPPPPSPPNAADAAAIAACRALSGTVYAPNREASEQVDSRYCCYQWCCDHTGKAGWETSLTTKGWGWAGSYSVSSGSFNMKNCRYGYMRT